jgi:hypothetical protein
MAKPRHERATAQAQENYRGSDTIGQKAQAAAALGEQAARASGNAARMAAGASEHAARAGADLFESTAVAARHDLGVLKLGATVSRKQAWASEMAGVGNGEGAKETRA